VNDLRDELAAEKRKNVLNNWVAVTVALISVFMSVTKVKDDNLVQAMLQSKSDAVDSWNEYQSKKLKHHMAELGMNQVQAIRLVAPGKGVAELAAQEKQYRDTISRYQVEEEAIMKKAKAHEKAYDDMNYRDDQFDLSDAALSICLGMLAVAALTNKRKLLYLAWGFAVLGVGMGIAGLLGLSIHPDALTRLLS
jgi:hypothetical protein